MSVLTCKLHPAHTRRPGPQPETSPHCQIVSRELAGADMAHLQYLPCSLRAPLRSPVVDLPFTGEMAVAPRYLPGRLGGIRIQVPMD